MAVFSISKNILTTAAAVLFTIVNIQAQTLAFLNQREFQEKIWNYEKNEQFVFEGETPVIIDFTASWCQPCRLLTPNLEKTQAHYGDKLIIYKVDYDSNKEIANRFRVRLLPSLVFIKPGEADYHLITGYKDTRQLKRLVRRHLGLR